MRHKRMMALVGMAGALCAVPLGIRATRNWRSAPALAEANAQRVAAPQNGSGDASGSRSETNRCGREAQNVRPVHPQAAPRPSANAQDRAEKGIGRVERIVSDRKMTARSADAFRAQMAPRLVAAGADRAVVQAWLDRTVPATIPHAIETTTTTAGLRRSPFDLSALTPEEREVIGMNANFIHATSLNNR